MVTNVRQPTLAFIEFCLLGLGLGLLQYLTPVGAMLVSIALGLIGLFTAVTGRGIPRLKSRSKAIVVFVVAAFFSASAASIYSEQREQRLTMLRATDPAAYLSELATFDEERWLDELRTLRPDHYTEELARREAVTEATAREAEALAERQAVEAEAGNKAAEIESARLAAEVEIARQGEATRRAEEVAARALQAKADLQAECQGNEALAYVMIQTDVRNALKAPSTAKFPGRYGNRTGYLGNCTYRVVGQFDAQNAFGAMLRGSFEGLIEYFPDEGSWRTIALTIDG